MGKSKKKRIRSLLYESGGSFEASRDAVIVRDLKDIQTTYSRLPKAKRDNYVSGLVNSGTLPEEVLTGHAAAPDPDSYFTGLSRTHFDVDHNPALVQHWRAVGHDASDDVRWAKVSNLADLRLLTRNKNRSDGAKEPEYELWVGKGFRSHRAEHNSPHAFTIDGKPFTDGAKALDPKDYLKNKP